MNGRVVLSLLASPVALAAQDSVVVRTAQVTYVSGGQVFVSAGREDGLAPGRTLGLVRAGVVVATLTVVYLGSHQASCTVTSGVKDAAPGDQVRYVPDSSPLRAAVAAGALPSGAPARPAERRRGGGAMHGRLAARYLVARVAGTGSLGRPALDGRFTASGLAGTPLGLWADVRARRASSTVAGAAVRTGGADVYQLALLWNPPGAPIRMTVGRQYLTAVSSLVLLDGVTGEINRTHLGAGAFVGSEPTPVLAFSPATRDLGAYVQVRGGSGTTRPWAVTTGLVGSYRNGSPNREFGILQARYTAPVVSLVALGEVDYYRGAKVAAGERPLSLTSSYLSASLRPAPGAALDIGFDNRRNVRLYRDVVDPVTAFDDRYRQAAWAGAGFGGTHLRVRMEGRTSAGAGHATALTGMVGLDRLTPHEVGVWARFTRYQAGQLHGWLGALRAAGDPSPALHLELNGGVRRETDPPVALGTRSTVWFGASAEVGIGRSWYLLCSGNREHSPDGPVDEAYASFSYRF